MPLSPKRVLVVDDEAPVREMIATVLSGEGYKVACSPNGAEAVKHLDRDGFGVCITDLKMPQIDGLAVLRHIQKHHHDTMGIVTTGHSSVENAIEALRLGAFDYLTKPFHVDEIRIAVERAFEVRDLRRESRRSHHAPRRRGAAPTMVGQTPQALEVLDLVETVADCDSTILILGESGTGKELVARAIHQLSPQCDRPLIPVNCGALPETLLESELFGHVKGAFTGAVADRPGRFQLADNGTIFLDEIGEMTPLLQVKLLRVLQEGQFEMVGSTRTVQVKTRVLAATNRNLEKMVEDGEFREDLYYRLHVIPIEVPPLRERIDDLEPLIEHFIERFNEEKCRSFAGFDDESFEALRRYPWPGNVRELENLVERCVILCREGKVGLNKLPEKYRGASAPLAPPMAASRFPETGVDLNQLVDEYETALIRQALDMANGVKNRAAQLLSIKRTTLVEKMKKKGMS